MQPLKVVRNLPQQNYRKTRKQKYLGTVGETRNFSIIFIVTQWILWPARTPYTLYTLSRREL